jgi:uncharacterized repeat protein (TIGR03803 family)
LRLEQLKTRLTPSAVLTTLASFDGADGATPQAGLVMDPSGDLYGTTQKGGAYGDGSVFMVPRGSSTIETVASFDGANGSDPVV